MKDIYVSFGDGNIKGDSRDKDHIGWVEVGSFNHTILQPKSATASTSGGHTAERVEFADLVFTKDIDFATPTLMAAVCSGTVVKNITVDFYRAYGGTNAGGAQNRVKYYQLKLVNTLVSSVTTTIGAEGLPVETFTLKPSAMSWEYQEHKIDGGLGQKQTKQWSLSSNTPTMS
jgi:type VI secretion system secreted protein Hcp